MRRNLHRKKRKRGSLKERIRTVSFLFIGNFAANSYKEKKEFDWRTLSLKINGGMHMRVLVNSAQMRQCDSNTIQHYGVPSLVLMERAALGVVEEIEKQVDVGGNILVVCGTGNNGGDGFAIGRILAQRGYAVTFVLAGNKERVSEETKQQIKICLAYGANILDAIPDKKYDVVVDAVFGIGVNREIQGNYYEIIQQMNQQKAWKVAVDIPSGIHTDTGEVMGIAFKADMTVTFAFEKIGIMIYPGAAYAGTVVVKDIGIGKESFLEEKVMAYCLEKSDIYSVPKRLDYSNKGTYGKVLVAAGHKNMAGAAFFSGKAAYATGAGLVKVYTEESNRTIIQELLPEAVLETYEINKEIEENIEDELKSSLEWANVIVAGPGMGTDKMSETIIKIILKNAKVPVILDADGLNIVSHHKEWLKERNMPLIVTPHLGEMARLTEKSIFDIQKQLLQVAGEFAEEYNVICVLKDARTAIALPDGTKFINTSGNNGMATAGAGDVLTGVIAGLLAQKMETTQAAPLGVYLHGTGADWMIEQTGTYGMMAQDIIEGVRQVLKEIDKEGI